MLRVVMGVSCYIYRLPMGDEPSTKARRGTNTAPGRADLRLALEVEENRRRYLEGELAKAEARVADLRSDLATLGTPRPIVTDDVAEATPPRSPSEKVRFFRELFRGREDVYPVRFISKKTGRSGYAPDCANKFVAGVCQLPKVKCGDCTRQAFRRVDERSRSGNGAHVWFFFSEPVAAAAARKMGCHLITETMAERHELSMDSYDRLFPSQDTMPRGGFGNLIALPLQHGPRKEGNSVFLDDDLNAYPDESQWAILAAVPRTDAMTVERIADEATRSGRVVGVRIAEPTDEEAEAAPWTRPPSGAPRVRRVPGPMPARMSAVLSQRLFVAKECAPAALLNQIKRLAAFQNPEFYKKQSMRLSTAMTPRIIACAEDLPKYVVLPRGYKADLEELLRAHGVALDVVDERVTGTALDVRFQGKLTAVQESAAHALLAHEMGVFVAPPGVGKTVIGTYLIAARACSTLVLVHRKPLLDQWLAQLALFLGIDRKDVGQIAGTKRAPTGRIDVAMIQSLVRREAVADLVASYGQVIVDECHHLPAVQFERALREVKARYVVGMTATPQRRDGHHPITEMQLGPVRFKVDAKAQAAARPFEHHLIVRETTFRLPTGEEKLSTRCARKKARASTSSSRRSWRSSERNSAAPREARKEEPARHTIPTGVARARGRPVRRRRASD